MMICHVDVESLFELFNLLARWFLPRRPGSLNKHHFNKISKKGNIGQDFYSKFVFMSILIFLWMGVSRNNFWIFNKVQWKFPYWFLTEVNSLQLFKGTVYRFWIVGVAQRYIIILIWNLFLFEHKRFFLPSESTKHLFACFSGCFTYVNVI